MGILDSLLNAATNAPANANPASPALPPALLDSLTELLSTPSSNGDNSRSGLSGLEDLVQRFGNAGLGDVIGSWIGQGENVSVTGAQLQDVLGSDFVTGLAQKLGMDPAVASNLIAQWLPRLIDQLTPGGRLPQSSEGNAPDLLSTIAGALLKPRA